MSAASVVKLRLHLALERFNFSRRLEMRYLTRQMRRYLHGTNGRPGIDIACGLGTLTHTVAAVSGSWVVGMDYNRHVLDAAHLALRSHQLTFVAADSHFLPLKPAGADFATSICAFEHFRDDRAAFAEVSKALRPGAYFFLTVDSLSHPQVTDAFRREHRRICHVCQYYSAKDIAAKLEQARFEVLDTTYLLRGTLASWLSQYGLESNFHRRYLIASALFYPFVAAEEWLRTGQFGYKLGVTARKLRADGS